MDTVPHFGVDWVLPLNSFLFTLRQKIQIRKEKKNEIFKKYTTAKKTMHTFDQNVFRSNVLRVVFVWLLLLLLWAAVAACNIPSIHPLQWVKGVNEFKNSVGQKHVIVGCWCCLYCYFVRLWSSHCLNSEINVLFFGYSSSDITAAVWLCKIINNIIIIIAVCSLTNKCLLSCACALTLGAAFISILYTLYWMLYSSIRYHRPRCTQMYKICK